MRYVLYAFIVLASFLAFLIAPLALMGGLNQETLGQLLGTAPPPQAAEAPADPIGPLAQELRDKKKALDAREKQLNQRQAELNQRELDLERLRTEIEQIQASVDLALNDEEKARQMRLTTIAITVEAMKPDKAAERLEGMTIQDQAAILNLVEKDKNRGKIIEAMSKEQATQVLRALKESTI